MTGKTSGFYWVGAFQTAATVDDWEWIDDTAFDTTKWFQGEPNDYQSSLSCVDTGSSERNFRFHDFPCANSLTYICEIPSETPAVEIE